MKKYAWCQFLLLMTIFQLAGLLSFSQSVGVGTATPDTNAALDIYSTTKGLLIPRGSAAFRTSLNANTTKGLLMFDTITNSLWAHNGNGLASGWQDISNPRVSFFSYATAGQTMSTSYTQITFSLEQYDDGNNFNTNAFTAPSAGIYHFDVRVIWHSLSATDQTVSLGLFNSGFSPTTPINEVVIPATVGVSGPNFTVSLSANLKLNAGDVVTVGGKQTTATGGGLALGSTQSHYFSGNKVY
ncbi:MAG: hypothetical protein Q8941_20085 [Bacteroidota bacterium]|nr:hypothetical protein [Bacteroidota bacterium]